MYYNPNNVAATVIDALQAAATNIATHVAAELNSIGGRYQVRTEGTYELVTAFINEGVYEYDLTTIVRASEADEFDSDDDIKNLLVDFENYAEQAAIALTYWL